MPLKTSRKFNRRKSFRGGEAPKKVYSYYSNRSESSSNLGRKLSLPETSRRFQLKNLPFYIAIVAIIICAGYLLTLSTNPKIIIYNKSKLSGLRLQGEYEKAAHTLMQSSLINQTKITIDTNKIERAIKNQFPELANVAVTLPIMGRRPVFKLQIAIPAIVIRSSNNEYILDVRGRVILPVGEANQQITRELPLVQDDSFSQLDIGQGILTSGEVSFINTIVAQLRAKNLTIESIILPQLASELHVKLKNKPYYVKFDLLEDAKTQIGTFLAVKRRLEARRITPLLYIDVRVEEKAYYR